MQSGHEDQKEKLSYAFFEYLGHSSKLIIFKERIKDLPHENFDLDLDQEHQFYDCPEILHQGLS